ncbi:MAG: HNH endonuclease [Acidimicrobiaceae bacterium]|nr:HNH endonuclease [Acidimicrobiaceae bacterium]MYE97993.1 HNH endonuclease [Acidimicrobiaceae bacterium]MYI55306.1 HNH endonuclease [Acidimicrobiaceae bacterium]
MTSLSDYLDLTVEQARSQWGQILARKPKKRQDPYTPVEAILCYGLFYVVDPHRHGGSSRKRMPPIVHELARLFVRPPGSLTNKMMNLDGSWAHAPKHEWQFFIEMVRGGDQFPQLYQRVLLSARDMGIGPADLPDFVPAEGDFDLLGQGELSGRTLETVVAVQAASHRLREMAGEHETTRLVEQSVRLGQHRFARSVLANYDHTCAFCGFSPRSLPRHRLLAASHIKPWADCDDQERLDVQNGVAACGVHDAAFDTGLITINGGLGVHKARILQLSVKQDPGADNYFEAMMRAEIVLPAEAIRPGEPYLVWHQQRIYKG